MQKYKPLLRQAAYILGAMAALFFTNTYLLAWAFVPTGSMIPTINEGSFILGTRLPAEKICRYDIVIFNYPDDESVSYIKRVIGLPGETITIKNGTVYADGKKLRDDFTAELSNDSGVYRVPEDSYFMLGDNRNHSKDSRFWKHKYVKREKIYAKALFVVLPFSDRKHLQENEAYGHFV